MKNRYQMKEALTGFSLTLPYVGYCKSLSRPVTSVMITRMETTFKSHYYQADIFSNDTSILTNYFKDPKSCATWFSSELDEKISLPSESAFSEFFNRGCVA